MTRQSVIKRFLPRSLLGRSLMIIVTPLVLLQVVSGFIFYESHWDKVTLRLARNLAGDIAGTITLLRQNPDNPTLVFDMAEEHMEMRLRMKKGDILPNTPPDESGLMEKMLVRAMREYVGKPFQIDTHSLDRHVVIRIQLTDSVLEVITTRKRLFSSTTYIFVLWMVGTAMILFGVAVIFMRNQVKPIRRLAFAADTFGKGRDAPSFKPEGAQEVRQAATAFIAMRDRIQRQITQRTDMLAGVSHDLRTPLTRMKLQLAMIENNEGAEDLKKDIADMERMLEAYLAFARGEVDEAPKTIDIAAMLSDVVGLAKRNGTVIDLHTEGRLPALVRPNAIRRCLTNLVENAGRYAENVAVRAGLRGEAIEVTIDDDGPGVPEEMREEVFRPFFRLEDSRNPVTGGVGLGLTVARDLVRGHGGDIALASSPAGGLRAKLTLPV